MTNIVRLLAEAVVVFAMLVTAALAQAPERKPDVGKPLTFGDSVRARDRLATTPQYVALATGLYARQIVQTSSDRGDYTVQVWSLIVSPRASTGETTLPGAAVVILYAGSVELVAGDRRTRLEPGATTAVPEGTSLRFVNGDKSRPAQLRAIVLTGNR